MEATVTKQSLSAQVGLTSPHAHRFPMISINMSDTSPISSPALVATACRFLSWTKPGCATASIYNASPAWPSCRTLILKEIIVVRERRLHRNTTLDPRTPSRLCASQFPYRLPFNHTLYAESSCAPTLNRALHRKAHSSICFSLNPSPLPPHTSPITISNTETSFTLACTPWFTAAPFFGTSYAITLLVPADPRPFHP